MRQMLVFSLAAIVALPLHAQVPPPSPAGTRRDFRGGRGSLFIAPSGKPFRASPGEPYPVTKWFEQADTNHDGKLTMSEMRDDAARFFAEIDTNHNGEIDPDEVHTYETVIAPEIQSGDFGGGPGGFSGGRGPRSSGGHRGGGGGGHRGGASRDDNGSPSQHQPVLGSGRGAGRYGLIDTPEPVTAADTDLDRSITLAEFKAKAISDFQELDSANRGYLTLADLPTADAQSHPQKKRSGHHRRDR